MDDAHRALSLLRVGLEQIVDGRRVGRVASDLDVLGLAAREYVAVEPPARQKNCSLVAHRLEPHQPERQALRQLFGRCRIGVVFVLGQQQARLEVGEPRRHDQIVGRDLELQLLRFGR